MGDIPHADENVSIPKDEQQDVVLCDVVEVCVLFIGEEQVWFPETLEHFGVHSEGITLKVCG